MRVDRHAERPPRMTDDGVSVMDGSELRSNAKLKSPSPLGKCLAANGGTANETAVDLSNCPLLRMALPFGIERLLSGTVGGLSGPRTQSVRAGLAPVVQSRHRPRQTCRLRPASREEITCRGAMGT